MTKIYKIIYACLLIPFIIVLALIAVKIKHFEELQQKVVLAQEIRKVLEQLIFDLGQARNHTVADVPADGVWHDHVAFDTARQGILEYTLNQGHLYRAGGRGRILVADDIAGLHVRREKSSPGILEIQIIARKNVSLTSNLRLRIQ